MTAITGQTSAQIAESIRSLIDRGHLRPGDLLPPVRALAEHLSVNRNTTVAAYRTLANSGLVESHGRAGTRVAHHDAGPQEGFTSQPTAELIDIANGNPLPHLIPDLTPYLTQASGTPVLYGEAVVDPGLEAWAREWMEPDVPTGSTLSVTSGAVDAIERLLAQSLMRDDAVGLENPGFLASQHTVRLGGYQPVPIEVDKHGMVPDSLATALTQGIRAVICTPRAHNPTGVSVTPERARELTAVLRTHPYVLIIEDDYYSMLARTPFCSVVPQGHKRWALIRSMSKFLGPDISVAVVATDSHTASRLALRLSPGTTWVSHLLQRLAHALVTSLDAVHSIRTAAEVYATHNSHLAHALNQAGVDVTHGDGISLWVDMGGDAGRATELLAKRGWLVRSGQEFYVDDTTEARHIRITAHALNGNQRAKLVNDLGEVRTHIHLDRRKNT